MTNVRSRWNQPAKYERWHVSSLGQVYAESLARVLRPWLAESAGSLVPDIDCGPGLGAEKGDILLLCRHHPSPGT